MKFNFPPGAIPEGKDVNLTVRPCLSGPFVLPPDLELASVVYNISPAIEFTQKVQLSLSHFADMQSEEDVAGMTFVTAKSTPVDGEYRFRVLEKGSFKMGNDTAIVALKHFCNIGVAKPPNGKRVLCFRRTPFILQYEYTLVPLNSSPQYSQIIS